MRNLAAVVFCLVCAQSTVMAESRQNVITSAVVDQVSGLVLVTGQFGWNPAVTIDGMQVRVISAAPQMMVVELPASVLNQPGSYLLTVTTNSGSRGTGFAIAVGAIGPQGPRGADGAPGAKGDRGDKGDPGAAGAKGDPGAAGAKGDPGAAGAKGDPGAAGAKGDPGAAGAKGDKGDKGEPGAPGLNGLGGQKGDKGDKGDAGPAGQGAPGVVDANGKYVGAFVSPDAVIVNIGGDWVRIALVGTTFSSCSSSPAGPCLMSQYEGPDCKGTRYIRATYGLTQDALVIDDEIYYPSGEVAVRPVGSFGLDSGGCFNVAGSELNAEAKSVALSSVAVKGALHLAR